MCSGSVVIGISRHRARRSPGAYLRSPDTSKRSVGQWSRVHAPVVALHCPSISQVLLTLPLKPAGHLSVTLFALLFAAVSVVWFVLWAPPAALVLPAVADDGLGGPPPPLIAPVRGKCRIASLPSHLWQAPMLTRLTVSAGHCRSTQRIETPG